MQRIRLDRTWMCLCYLLLLAPQYLPLVKGNDTSLDCGLNWFIGGRITEVLLYFAELLVIQSLNSSVWEVDVSSSLLHHMPFQIALEYGPRKVTIETVLVLLVVFVISHQQIPFRGRAKRKILGFLGNLR